MPGSQGAPGATATRTLRHAARQGRAEHADHQYRTTTTLVLGTWLTGRSLSVYLRAWRLRAIRSWARTQDSDRFRAERASFHLPIGYLLMVFRLANHTCEGSNPLLPSCRSSNIRRHCPEAPASTRIGILAHQYGVCTDRLRDVYDGCHTRLSMRAAYKKPSESGSSTIQRTTVASSAIELQERSSLLLARFHGILLAEIWLLSQHPRTHLRSRKVTTSSLASIELKVVPTS